MTARAAAVASGQRTPKGDTSPMARDHYEDARDLASLCAAIAAGRGGHNVQGVTAAPLVASDFADIRLTETEFDFPQGVHGVRFEFVMSNHSLEKMINSQDLADALNRLVVPLSNDDDGRAGR